MSADPASQPRLFVLEQGRDRPSDYSVGAGPTEMLDVPLKLRFDGTNVRVAARGYGPSVFVLPGARRVQVGSWTRVEPGARVSWAGRDWTFLVGRLPGDAAAPPRGVLLNGHAAGHPDNAVLLEVQGDERGNFWRFRSEPAELVDGVDFRAVRDDEALELHLRVADTPANNGRVEIDGEPVTPGTTVTLAAGQLVRIVEDDATVLSVAVVRS